MPGRRSTIRGRELGRRFLAIQRAAGLTGTQLADRFGLSPSLLSRITTGHRPARPVEVATLLGSCGVLTGAERDRMLALSEPYRDETGLYLAAHEQWPIYREHARDATSLIEYQPVILPWLLQTPAYTRALLTDSPLGDVERELLIAARREGKDLLRRPRVELFVSERVLRTPVGATSEMSEQLHHVIRMSVSPSLSVRVVPGGRDGYVGAFGPFTLLGSSDYLPVLYREDHGGARLVDDTQVVDVYRSLVHWLRRVALDEQRSRELLGKVATELYGDHGTDVALPVPPG